MAEKKNTEVSEASAKLKKENTVLCILRPNNEYGRAIRKGKSGRKYRFSVKKWEQPTEVLESDLPDFTDPKSKQFVKHLEIIKK